ncbi:DHA2 family efflux MFS transporter permease subunit [Priestia aryabhattai]|uniref:DHA2 family efflux MFS transporter permease subunit n=1 Tax=Priestia aryabhattai TaxID=412384 RepID=UPI0008DE5582|nr:DHA2 family efflux MFS transporter permease subunit [Priestia aryabhattai]MBX9969629.1 DHA2 family efflux MFS transporter permease subunit [Priestia aryabhattai]MBZ6484135.1 DHA2 family efflux MFS transporter permease subunit [Priestia aryabhattai]MDH3134159.1 DHA2 family efflux MFS transporter permease subunit [Priestia aryabhattai]MED4154369.1 DHA2 family efflux MFS transporter permease subunit [Priestia aryabhattai]OHY77201.1 MFS transporter [Priestia aryabhattai]
MMTASIENPSDGSIKKHIPLLIVLMLGLFLAILNQTLLNVAIPHLITEFGVTANTAQWLLTGYMLVNGALIPLSAFLIERFGVRRLFLFAMVCFTVGSLICGIAPTFSIMLTGRLIQAIGGGVLSPLVMTIIVFIFPPHMRGKGMGIFGLAMMFAPAIGPTLSGWVIQNYDWHILFNGMVPLGAIVLIIAFFQLKDIQPPKDVKVHMPSVVTSLAGMGLLLYGFSEAGNDGWTDSVVLSTIIGGTVLLIIFVLQQIKSEKPLLDMRVFKYNIFSLSNIISIAITISMYAGMFLLPIYLQNIRGYSAFDSGLLLLPGALVMLVMSPISGTLFDKVGPRPLAIVGMLITSISTFEFTKLTMDTPFNHILAIYIIRSFGMSLLMMPIMTAGLNQLPQRLSSHGTSMSNTLRQVSGSIGISLMTTIFTNRTTYHVNEISSSMNTSDPFFMNSFHLFVQKVAATLHLSQDQAQQQALTILSGKMTQQGTIQGINDAFYWATAISVIGLILSFFLRDVRKDKVVEEKKSKAQEEDIRMLPAPKSINS